MREDVIPQTHEIFAQVVSEAIAGKYHEITHDDVVREVAVSYKNVSGARTVEELVTHCQEIGEASDDINNQVVALTLLDMFPNSKQLRQSPMTFLHRIVYAKQLDEMKRTTQYVADFSADTLTKVSQIDARFQELETLVRSLAITPVDSLAVGAHLLAHVYAAAIRIHFFKDGNGRVARFTVQYLLKRWGKRFVALPKVRNDPNWKDALSYAIGGEVGALALILETRLVKAWDSS